MTIVILAIIIGLIFGLVNAAAGTVYGLCKSNIVGGKEGEAKDFMGNAEVIFHEKRDEKVIYSLSGARTVDATKPYVKRSHW